jgi:vacuolar-type H+-ATPase subunit E/Vma4
VTPQAPLVDELLAQAERQAQALIEKARHDASGVMAEAADKLAGLTDQELGRGRAESERRRAVILSTVPLRERRLRQLRVEGLLTALAEEARQRLLALGEAERKRITLDLAVAAVAQLSTDACVVKLAPGEPAPESAQVRAALVGLRPQSACTIQVLQTPDLQGPGPLVASADGHQLWDNRLLERLTRLWPALRSQVAARLPGASAHATETA